MSRYRLIVGEVGNEQGHVVPTRAGSLKGARRALRREIDKYNGDGWGGVEYLHVNGEWEAI